MKSVLVSGGSRGVGLSVCRELAARGYKVLTVSRTITPALDQVRSDFPGLVEAQKADLSDPGQVKEFAHLIQSQKHLFGFVANAAVGLEGLLTLTASERIEHCIQLNLISVIMLTREVIKAMLPLGQGSLVFISSVSATRGFSGLSVYSATKGALVSFSRSIAREYGARGIRSNCVVPGFLETEMTRGLSLDDRERIRRRTALGRLGTASDILSTVMLLLSEESNFVTGTEIVVDGGLTV